MANKILETPQELMAQRPKWDYKKPWIENQTAEKLWLDSIREWAKNNGEGEYAGKEVRFQVADGYACYAIMSLKPVTLIHLPVADCYESELASYLPAKRLIEEAEYQNRLARFFTEQRGK